MSAFTRLRDSGCPATAAGVSVRASGRPIAGAGGVLAFLSATGVALALAGSAGSASAQSVPSADFSALHYRYIGPVGNRLDAVAGVPGDRETYYAGAAAGGVWKTVDGGLTWKPVFDGEDVSSIGALAVAPSDPNVVWAGTGESFIRSNVSVGDGVYRSTDGGAHWRHMGLEKTGRIARIVIDPTDPDVVYVAALGNGYQPQQERGIYRTRDGGKTWDRVLFVNDSTGASDLAMDPNNPRILFAGMWQLDIKTWGRESGGAGSGLFMSRDGGDTWTRLTGHGLPEKPVGKVAVCMTPASSDRIYALIETGDGVPWHGRPTDSGELWRSDDGGTDWQLASYDRDLAGRQAYYTRCAVAPDDPDEAYFIAADFSHTTDGGATIDVTRGATVPNWDHHDMWIDPQNGARMIVAGDGGVSISENRGRTWFRIQLPVGQLYHVTVDNQVPYNVYGNRQDGPSTRGPSNSRTGEVIPRGMWHSVGGGESGFATPDTMEPGLVWSSASGSGAVGGIVIRYNEKARQYRQVEVWPMSTIGWPAKDLRYRFQWTFPLLISPHDHNTVYVTSQVVHRTTDGGQSWQVISPDLTTNDTTKMGISGGLTPDNIGVEYCCVIYAFDESPAQAGVLWAGSNDGLVHVSRDDGKSWTDVTRNIPDLPPLGIVRNIDASKYDAGKAYMTVDRHQMGDFEPYVYRTSDYGRHWTKITAGIPESPVRFARNVIEDPVRPGLLYLGTENTIYVSFDDGDHWQPLRTNLPPAPMYWLVVQPHFNDLVVASYGRGFWILDDVTPLQQLTAEVAASPAHLFAPRPAYRFQEITEPFAMSDDWSAGHNPPYGADINYWLKDGTDSVTIRIMDAAGDTVRTFKGSGHAGINRAWWNLRGEPSTQIRMRTKPLYADWVPFNDEGWRAAGGRVALLEPPGTYTVALEVGGHTFTRPLTVLKDPNSEGGAADIAKQLALLTDIRSDLDAAARMVNRIEWMRRQLQDLASLLKARGHDDVLAADTDLEQKLIAVESRLVQLKTTGYGQDGVRYPSMVVGRLGYLAGAVESADFPPTDQDRQVHDLLYQQLRAQHQALAELEGGAVAAFNRLLAQKGLSGVISQTQP